jgi:hypothetical protein
MSSIEKEHMRSVAERLAGAIDSAVIMGDGAKKVVTLPNSTISGRQYNITLKGNALLLKWKGSDYATRFSTSDLNMTAIDPYTLNLTNITLNPGNILVTNSNGTIKLQNVEDNFI